MLVGAMLLGGCGGDGGTGATGEAGHSALLETQAEAAGENCEYGGTAIFSGVDLDGDGALSEAEITATSYICAGAPGEPGEPGEAGPGALIETGEATGCGAAGGTHIRVGVDANSDGVLQDEEVTGEDEICNPPGPSDTPILIDRVDVPPGDTCDMGGSATRVGRDLDGDGELALSEVESSIVDCEECPEGTIPSTTEPNECVAVTTIAFEGTVTEVIDDDGLNPGMAPGDAFTGTIRYSTDQTFTNSHPGGGEPYGIYRVASDPFALFTVTVDGQTLSSKEPAEVEFTIQNDFGYAQSDTYQVDSLSNENFGGLTVEDIQMRLVDFSHRALSSYQMRPPFPFAEANDEPGDQRFFMIRLVEPDSGGGGGGPQPPPPSATVMGEITSVTVQ
jgi:hypothetical protein